MISQAESSQAEPTGRTVESMSVVEISKHARALIQMSCQLADF